MSISKLLTQLKESKQKIEHFVSHGSVHDFPQYKFLVGKIGAFEETIEMCRKLLKESGEIDE